MSITVQNNSSSPCGSNSQPQDSLGVALENVRKLAPLVHNITNTVTINDCANVLLACGASPIMSDDAREMVELSTICNALNINIGTLNKRSIESMFIAGEESNRLEHPVVLDPVGAGATSLRTETTKNLLEKIDFTVIKGNISEIKTLALGQGSTKGVDANIADTITEDNLDSAVTFVKSFSAKTGAIIVVTGPIDIVADSEQAYCVYNGHKLMGKVTGTGCQLSALLAAFVAANPQAKLSAATSAVVAMGLAGEKAHARLGELEGNSTYRNYIIDAICNLTGAELEEGAKYEIR